MLSDSTTRWRPAAVLAVAFTLPLTAIAVWGRVGRVPNGLAFSAIPERAGNSIEDVRLPEQAALRDLRSGAYRVRWRGYWLASRPGRHRLHVRAPVPFELRVAGRPVLNGGPGVAHGEVQVESGANAFEVELAGASRRTRLRVTHAAEGAPPRPFAAEELAPRAVGRGSAFVSRVGGYAGGLAAAAWVLALGLVIWPERRGLGARLVLVARRLASPKFAWALGALVVLYAGALRAEALIARYGDGDVPRWAPRLEASLRDLHTARLRWKPVGRRYEGDPGAYLRHAREMEGFYDARFREPFFVFAAKAGVGLAGGRDIGISLASAGFSTLAVAATFLLGAQAFSPWVGLMASLGFAVDQRVVSLSPEGWRDDAFAFLCVAFAWLALRLYDRDRFADALGLGLLGGLACLTRITSLSFVVPALVGLAFVPRSRPWRVRLEHVAVGALTCGALLAPFLLSCWVAYDDPLVSINGVAPAYQSASGIDMGRDMGAIEYLAARFRTWELLDTLVIGATAYPFAAKWNFDYLSPRLAGPAAAAGAAGMLLLCLARRTRLLVALFAAALFPFTLTWNVKGGDAWRLTLFAYPFYLVAAAFVWCGLVRLAVDGEARGRLQAALSERTTWLRVGVVSGGAGLVALAALGLPYWRLDESLRHGQAARVVAGPRDRLFFGEGWQAPTCAKNVCARYSDGTPSQVRLPLEGGRDYTLRLRAYPLVFPGMRPQRLTLLGNGTPLAELALAESKLAGVYEARWPAHAVKNGRNLLEIRAAYDTVVGTVGARDPLAQPSWRTSFALLQVEVAPAGGSGLSESRGRRRREPESRAPSDTSRGSSRPTSPN